MNDDPTPPPAAAQDLPGLPSSSNPLPSTFDPVADIPASREARQDALGPAQKSAQAQTRKKYEFINTLMTNLDVLIYAELCIVYYMDCSFFRLLLRVLAQMMFLTPKPNFIPPMPQHRPYIGAIFGPNVICSILHIITRRSEAGEAMRGYLHGGIIIDLIGQKGPTSKVHLVILDILVLMLQCFMLAVHAERERLLAALAVFVSPTPAADQPRDEVVSSQDHDAEERGVVQGAVTTSNGDIELQPMASATAATSSGNPDGAAEQDEERERLLAEPAPRQDAEDDDTPLDVFWSGTAIVADFHVLSTLRKQWVDYGNATGSALQSVGFQAEFAAVGINAATTRFQRNMGALGS